MSQIRNRNSKLQLDASDALPMGAFRPHPSWFEEHWLVEAPPAPPSTVRRHLTRLAGFVGALNKRLIARRLSEHLAVPKPQTH
jgi:hypothetical protein